MASWKTRRTLESDAESNGLRRDSEAAGCDANPEFETGPVEELLCFGMREPRDVFEKHLSEAWEGVSSSLTELLERSDARDDPIWQRVFGARPTRGALLNICKAAGVKIHPDNKWANYN